MADDTLAQKTSAALKGANDFLHANQDDPKARSVHLGNLEVLASRLQQDIQERLTSYLSELSSKEAREIDSNWNNLNSDQKYIRRIGEEKSYQDTFERYRLANGGALPKNISPVLYSIPLILVGVSEWYVNYSTFAAIFVPVVAMAGTLIVGAIFAVTSHLHGSYLKQLSEIFHPSTEYRNVIGRKIVVAIATILLLAAFSAIIYLRYLAIADQLGIGAASSGTFSQPSGSLVWSRLGPTIVINISIWGLGTLYSWAMHERVPDIRDSYRRLLRANRQLDKMRTPFVAEEKRIKAKYEREREMNQVAVKDYKNCHASVLDMICRINGDDSESSTAQASAGGAQ